MLVEQIKLSTELFPMTRYKAPGTCGELIQGYLDGRDFLVNCPIDNYSYVTLYSRSCAGLSFSSNTEFSKVKSSVKKIIRDYQLDMHHHIQLNSDIPVGKGMASSTADMAATISAMCKGFQLNLSHSEIASIIVDIEPFDGVHFPGISEINHLKGGLIDSMDAPSDLSVIVIDCGGEVDTQGFDRAKARAVYQENRSEVLKMIDLLKIGMISKNNTMIGRAATISSELSQKILFKPFFPRLAKWAEEHNCYGVNCAHSGTILGILYQTSDDKKHSILKHLSLDFDEQIEVLGAYEVISGGCYEY